MSRKRIFFAADERLLAALAEPLRRCGLVVETFKLQSELVPAARIDAPDAILLNARLPDGSALSVYQALASIGPPPTVVILTQSQIASRAGLLQAGIADVLVSPIRPKALGARMAEVAGGVRRNEARERVALSVVVQFEGKAIQGVTVNISRDGMGLSLREPLRAGSVVSMTLAGVESTFSIWGRVIHARGDGQRTQVGLRLLGLTSQEENELLTLVRDAAQRQKRVAPPPPPVKGVPSLAPAPTREKTRRLTPEIEKTLPAEGFPLGIEASLEPLSEKEPENLEPPPAPEPATVPPTLDALVQEMSALAGEAAEESEDEPSGTLAAADFLGARTEPPPQLERWPEALPTWLRAVDALRASAQLFSELSDAERKNLRGDVASLSEKLAHRSPLELGALRYVPQLSPIERRALQPDPAIEILLEDDDPASEVVPEPALRPAIAAQVSICAAHRFRGMTARARGAAIVDTLRVIAPEARPSFRVDGEALRQLLDDLEQWHEASRACIEEARALHDSALVNELEGLRTEVEELGTALCDIADALGDGPPPPTAVPAENTGTGATTSPVPPGTATPASG